MTDPLQDRLARLKSLHELDLLTDDDFKEQKRALLGEALGTGGAHASTVPLSGATTVGVAAPSPPPASSTVPLSGATTMEALPTGGLSGPTRGLTIMGRAATAASTDITTLPPGAVFDGRYSVVSTLGIGGMGAVYQAVDTQLNQLVALKALRPEISDDPQMVDLLRQEVSLAQRLNHPNLLTLRHLDTDGDAPYVIMELMEGGDLEEHLASKGGQLSSGEALPFFRGVLSGLSALHKEKIAHLDVKPANVLLGRDGRIKLSDFGISSRLKDQRDGGLQAGTPEYAPPEQLSGEVADVRADLYAVGILVHQLLTGAMPYSAKTVEVARAWHREGARTFPALPAAIAAVVAKATAVKPAERYRSADEFLQALEAAIHQKPWTTLDQASVAAIQGQLHGEVLLPNGDLLEVDEPAQLLVRGAAWPTPRTIAGRVLLQTHSMALLWMRRSNASGALSKEAQAAAMAILQGDPDLLIRLPPQTPVDECALALFAFHSGDQSVAIRRLDQAERRLSSFDDHMALCVALAGGLGNPSQLAMAVSAAQKKASSAPQRAAVAVATAFLLSDQRQAQRILLEMERASGDDASAWLTLTQAQIVVSTNTRDWSRSRKSFLQAAARNTEALEDAVFSLPEDPALDSHLAELLMARVGAAEANLEKRGLSWDPVQILTHARVDEFCQSASYECGQFDENERRRRLWNEEESKLTALGFDTGSGPASVSEDELASKQERVATAVAAQHKLQSQWDMLLERAAEVGVNPPGTPRPLGPASIAALSDSIDQAALEAEVEASAQRMRAAGLTPINPPPDLTTDSVRKHVSDSTTLLEQEELRVVRRAARRKATISAAAAAAVGLICVVVAAWSGANSIVFLLVVGGVPNALVWFANLDDLEWDGDGDVPREVSWQTRRFEKALLQSSLPFLLSGLAMVASRAWNTDLIFGGYVDTPIGSFPSLYASACVVIPALAWGWGGPQHSATSVIPIPQREIIFASGTATAIMLGSIVVTLASQSGVGLWDQDNAVAFMTMAVTMFGLGLIGFIGGRRTARLSTGLILGLALAGLGFRLLVRTW